MITEGSKVRRAVAEFITAAREAPRIYFAPLRGAITGVTLQWRQLQNCHQNSGTKSL